MINIKKTEEYVLLTPESSNFDDQVAAAMEKAIAGLYSAEGRIHYIVDLDQVDLLSVSAVKLFDKVQKIAQREAGLFCTVVNNDDVMDVMADHSAFELLMLSSVEEAIEVIYMYTQDQEDEDGDEEEMGDENDY
jgi:anti-anti-sigma regulatory factor